MKNIWENFDGESKELVKELTRDDKKFNKLVSKLQTAKDTMNDKVEVVKPTTEKVK